VDIKLPRYKKPLTGMIESSFSCGSAWFEKRSGHPDRMMINKTGKVFFILNIY